MGDHGQIEVYSNGSTHTLYEFCGFDDCRENILVRGFQIEEDPFARDEFVLTDGDGETVKITVRHSLDESDSCVWCFGCGDFLRHANAGTPCECKNPDKDREIMRPLVQEEPLGRLELRPWGPHSGMLPDFE
jgi:hypothetical protein